METALSTSFFTKEFLGYEIESKWEFLPRDLFGFVFQMNEDIALGKWGRFEITKTLGALPIGMRYFSLQFSFYASRGVNGLTQLAMVAHSPDNSRFMVAFKGETQEFAGNNGKIYNCPLLRKESRKGNWVTFSEMHKIIMSRDPEAISCGTIQREKCSFYFTNLQTNRNFNISADRCYFQNNTLSQVEIEYKGRSGIWLPDTTGQEILEEYRVIHDTIQRLYGQYLVPTTRRKFDWICEMSS